MITGIDVSHWQGRMDWSKAKEAGASFGIFKATDFWKAQPRGFVDSEADNNWSGTLDAGLINGCYCWLQPKVDPTVQANFFLEFWNVHPCNLPPILDVEDTDVFNHSDMLWRVQKWLQVVEDALDIKPMVYTSYGYMMSFDKSKAQFLSQYPLWQAWYSVFNPKVPAPWTSWTIWQHTAKGDGQKYGAVAKNIDMNKFDGTLDDLKRLCNMEVEPSNPQPDPTPAERVYEILQRDVKELL